MLDLYGVHYGGPMRSNALNLNTSKYKKKTLKNMQNKTEVE